MRGVFVDANESLALIFERLERKGDPKVRIHRDPEITSNQLPRVIDGAEIAIVEQFWVLSRRDVGVAMDQNLGIA